MRTIILDSSVFAKWFFPEEGSEKALEIKALFTNNDIAIIVPVLVYHEVSNLLKTAVKVYRVEEKNAIKAIDAFLRLNLISYASSDLFQSALAIAIKFDVSAYDAAYVALSKKLQVPLITADKKLVKKVNSNLVIDLDRFNL